MIAKIIGKISTYIGIIVCVAELELKMCGLCKPHPCPLILGIGISIIIAGCIVHEVDEK